MSRIKLYGRPYTTRFSRAATTWLEHEAKLRQISSNELVRQLVEAGRLQPKETRELGVSLLEAYEMGVWDGLTMRRSDDVSEE